MVEIFKGGGAFISLIAVQIPEKMMLKENSGKQPSKRKTPIVPTSPSTGVCLHPDNHNTSVDSSSKVYNRLSDVGVQSVYRLRGSYTDVV